MTPNPLIMKSVERLGYRVSVGDVAAGSGLELDRAREGLLSLASDVGGHLQVSDSGEIIYLYPRDFRAILRGKYLGLRLKEWWEKVWKVIFYLIRISFGIVLIVSISVMLITIFIILIAINSSRDNEGSSGRNNDGTSGGGGNILFLPYYWSPDIFWWFDPGYEARQYRLKKQTAASERKQMNFLEAIFSFLFGDGNPNIDLEERRWQEIGSVIRNHQGAVIGKQIAPYLDDVKTDADEDEDYILPVLARFNGYPEVSDNGDIIYYFPDLQVSASQWQEQQVSPYLREYPWRFSSAGSGQILLSIGLGAANLILALILGSLLRGDIATQIGGWVMFVNSIYWILLGYGIAFFAIPLIRYFWNQSQNHQIERREHRRQQLAMALAQPDDALKSKINYARQFAARKVISNRDIAYTTEKDLLEQEDDLWKKRFESNS